MPPSSLRPPAALVALAFALALCASPAWSRSPIAPGAVAPGRIWVAWLDGKSLEESQATGAIVIDRFPDAVVVADASSARVLAASGFRVETPVDLPAGRTVTLLRPHGGPAHRAAIDPVAFARLGVRVAWSGGENALVVSDGALPDDALLLEFDRKGLRSRPLAPRPVARGASGPELHATDFAPIIQEMVDQVSGAEVIDWIGNLAGSKSVTVGGNPVTFMTRSSQTAQCDLAEQYVYERLSAMGYTDVQYDPFSFSSVNARNVVATLPGTETPQRIVILGAHLDSTSPLSGTLAPGANDNASGVAGMLAVAEILRQYQFRSTIKVIAFTGEEQGLHGSAHYAAAARARGDSIVGVVIFDMMAWHDAQYQIDIEGETAWLPLMTVMSDACARYSPTLGAVMEFVSFGSDHVPFQDEGYPAFLAIESEYDSYPCYHQTCDTTGWNEPQLAADVVRASLATVAHLAGPRDFFIAHTPLPSTENTVGPYEVVATITPLAPLLPDSLLLRWSTGGGFTELPLTATGTPNQFHAFIPGQPAGSHVTYWLSAVDSADRHAVHPTGAPGALNEFWVSPRTTLLSEGFEDGAPGWSHGGTGDDWQFAAPAGLAEDPATAYAGTKIAGTDITGLGANLGKYENFSESWLESPAVNCSLATQVRLSFARKLAVERSNNGTWDYARVLVNGVTAWQSPSAPPNLIDPAWTPQELDISALADGHPAVRVRFTLHSDISVVFGGWNLDEVSISGISSGPIVAVSPIVPAHGLVLHANVPNPGAPATTLRFDLPSAAFVDLSIYDVRGRLVRTMVHERREPGRHEVRWDGRAHNGAPSATGVYFYRLTTGDAVRSRKLILMR